ncbi:MAG TPA: protein tyrosine phosphatase family protein [Actinomycetota bacterium]|nr:protein tyrosine phosphatase family protein [Actinomycetota bacterium]
MGIESSYNFRRVSDRLTTSGVIPRDALEGLADEGYGLVIDLLPADSEYATPDEREVVEGQGLEYVHIPVDFDRPTPADLHRFTEAMDAAGDRRTHVHCAANFRVSAFYSVYALQRGRWTPEEARAHLAGIWDPREHPAWTELIRGAGGDALLDADGP